MTWLYGPLHLGSDWSKPLEPPSPLTHRQASIDSAALAHGAAPAGKKPILKRRSISQLLSLPASPFFAQEGSDVSDNDDSGHHSDQDEPSRPPLLHTKSDTHISWRSRAFRKDSPPRIIASEDPHNDYLTTTSASTSDSTGSDQDLTHPAADAPVPGKKKHISFNTFVEQCIAIEKPPQKRLPSGTRFFHDSIYDDGSVVDLLTPESNCTHVLVLSYRYDEDSETGDEDDADKKPSSFFVTEPSGMGSDSDDDDDVLEIRPKRSRSSSSSRSSRTPAMPTAGYPNTVHHHRPPLARQASIDRERVTIAPIAPTTLKTTGVGNDLVAIGEEAFIPQKELDLVYVPPSNSIYSLPGTPNLGGTEDVYRHRESYFSVGTDRSFNASRSADSSPIIPTFTLPRESGRQVSLTGNLNQFFEQPPSIPFHAEPSDVREEPEDFGVSDSGEDYSTFTPHSRIVPPHTDDFGGDALGIHLGRSRERSPLSASPQIVVNEVAGAEEEREETSTGSSDSAPEVTDEFRIPRKPDTRMEADIPLAVSFITHDPAIPVPSPRVSTHAVPSTSPSDPAFLSPTEVSRGRSPGCSPVSGSTTTGSYSYSTDSRSGSRGRSSTRNSSFSDRERSGSRSSRGTNSPLGSISPTGSTIAIGASHAQGRGRDPRATARVFRRDDERGRDRAGRSICDSLSPPSLIGSPSRSVSDDFPAYSPVMEKSALPSSSASVSESSASGSSTASIVTVAPQKTESEREPRGRSNLSRAMHIPIPSPIPEEEETRSRQPTPANSPVRALSSPHTPPHVAPGSPLHVTPPPKSRPSEPVTSPSEAQALPTSPSVFNSFRGSRSPERIGQEQNQPGTLVSRAAEIVSSARGFLGAIWNAV